MCCTISVLWSIKKQKRHESRGGIFRGKEADEEEETEGKREGRSAGEVYFMHA